MIWSRGLGDVGGKYYFDAASEFEVIFGTVYRI